MLEYKERELRELQQGTGKVQEGENLERLREDVRTIADQIEGLRAHFSKRNDVLDDLRRQIQDEKRSK